MRRRCRCGNMIDIPQLNEAMFVGEVKGEYRLSISYACSNPKCDQSYRSDFKGKVEEGLISLKK
jgi:hypothetical protein